VVDVARAVDEGRGNGLYVVDLAAAGHDLETED
jgi:hypothetical protein